MTSSSYIRVLMSKPVVVCDARKQQVEGSNSFTRTSHTNIVLFFIGATSHSIYTLYTRVHISYKVIHVHISHFCCSETTAPQQPTTVLVSTCNVGIYPQTLKKRKITNTLRNIPPFRVRKLISGTGGITPTVFEWKECRYHNNNHNYSKSSRSL